MRTVKNLTLYLFILVLFSTYGCVQMRDYTGTRDGSFIVGVNRGFDQGVDKKSYRMVGENIALIIGDTKNDVIFKIGLPTESRMGLDGYESWVYKDREIDLFFSGNRLKGWSSYRYEETKAQEEK